MARYVVLDSGPLGLASQPSRRPEADACRDWIRGLVMAGVRVVVPEIADYETRRELIRVGATKGLARLDQLEAGLRYEAITTRAMRKAAEYWAVVRAAGLPTDEPAALDADAILAGQAATVGRPDDPVTIATTNARHLARFPDIDARAWESIRP